MIPSILSSQVRKGVEDFLKATLPVSTPFFHGVMDRFLGEDGGVFKGPYLSIKLPSIFRLCLNFRVEIARKWGTFVQRQLLVNRAPALTLWAVVGEVLGGQRTAPEDAQGRKSDR